MTQFIATIPDNVAEAEKRSLERSQKRLQTKIQVINPAIDLIELVSARGNTSLDSTLHLVSELKADILEFEKKVAVLNELAQKKVSPKERQLAAKEIQLYISDLLERIEESIPLISLALTTSGANLSSRMPDSVSPGRFLQAGRFLSEADSKYEDIMSNIDGQNKDTPKQQQPVTVQVGPTFTVIMYTIFYGQARHVSWKEEFRRCNIRLWRVNKSGAEMLHKRETDGEGQLKYKKNTPSTANTEGEPKYQYMMSIDQSFKDGRYHDEEEKPLCMILDLTTVVRLFFSASGSLLQIDESNSPVLVLKLDPTLHKSTSEKENDDDDDETEDEAEEEDKKRGTSFSARNVSQGSGKSSKSDHGEWLAFEQYFSSKDIVKPVSDDEEGDENNDSSDDEDEDPYLSASAEGISQKLESLSLETGSPSNTTANASKPSDSSPAVFVPPKKLSASAFKSQFFREKASLSLLEYLIRLAALQSNDQDSVYNTTDERIAVYLTDENSNSQNKNKNMSSKRQGDRSAGTNASGRSSV